MPKKASKGRRGRRDLADLYLLGIGHGGRDCLTLGTRDVLRKCRVVLDMSEVDYLAEFNPNCVRFDDLYWSGELYDDVYAQVLDLVLAEVANGPGVGLVGDGHPLVFDSINLELMQSARRRGLDVRVLPAVSCLGTLCIDLGIDYGDGLQIFEAGDLLLRGMPINPNVDALILQLGNFGTERTDGEFDFRKGHFTPFMSYLAKFYSLEQKMAVVCSAEGSERTLFWTRLRNLDRSRNRIFPGVTLYVPAVVSQ